MSAVATFKVERGLSHILRDIAVADRAWRAAVEARSAELESAALDHLSDLKAEGRIMVQAMTGCPWASIEEALA